VGLLGAMSLCYSRYRCRHCGIEGPRDRGTQRDRARELQRVREIGVGSYRIDDPNTCAGVWRMDGMSDQFMDERCCNCAKKHLPKYAETYDMRACRHCKLRLEREQRAREAQRRKQEERSLRVRQELVQDLVAALAQAGAAGDASRAAAALVGGVAMGHNFGGPGGGKEKGGVDELEADARLALALQEEENVRQALPAARLAADSPCRVGEKAMKEKEKSDLRAAVAGKKSEQCPKYIRAVHSLTFPEILTESLTPLRTAALLNLGAYTSPIKVESVDNGGDAGNAAARLLKQQEKEDLRKALAESRREAMHTGMNGGLDIVVVDCEEPGERDMVVVDCAEPDGKRPEKIKGGLESFPPSPCKCFANGSQEKGIHQNNSDSVNEVMQQALAVKSEGKIAKRERARERESFIEKKLKSPIQPAGPTNRGRGGGDGEMPKSPAAAAAEVRLQQLQRRGLPKK
jgi:hypothetical protein